MENQECEQQDRDKQAVERFLARKLNLKER
jgi:hypothetical protein